VITFEECWPLASKLDVNKTLDSKIHALVSVARSIKFKDAGSLGALAYAHSAGDNSVLALADETGPIRLVAEAIKRPGAFFEWCNKNCTSQVQLDIVRAARRYLGSAGWAWDKACILAAAYLASAATPPQVIEINTDEQDFPYWVALDKHTPQGKNALRSIAREVKKPYRQLLWASFYFESALVTESGPSPWWEVERLWRLRKAGLSVDEAKLLWESVLKKMQDLLALDAIDLKTVVEYETGSYDKVGPQGDLRLVS